MERDEFKRGYSKLSIEEMYLEQKKRYFSIKENIGDSIEDFHEYTLEWMNQFIRDFESGILGDSDAFVINVVICHRKVIKYIQGLNSKGEHGTNAEQEIPKTFEELFYNPEHAEPCLKILSELQPPFIDALNNYIGKAKGIFPLWIKVLKNYKPEPFIKHFKDSVYKDLLNTKVKGLNLTYPSKQLPIPLRASNFVEGVHLAC